MGKNILEIYKEYKLMPSLQDHMFRVAAVAYLICDNFNDPLQKEEIILTCLLHDMGNIIKSDLNYFPEFIKPEGLEYWQKIKDEYIEKYGKDEHQATLEIIRELNINNADRVAELVDAIDFKRIEENLESEDLSKKICQYADLRVDPHGVVSYEKRMEDGRKRYENRPGFGTLVKRDDLVACGKEIEKQIFFRCKIKPEDINNDTVEPIISELRNFVIK